MVSTMTSDDLERVFAEHLDKTGRTGRVPGAAGGGVHDQTATAGDRGEDLAGVGQGLHRFQVVTPNDTTEPLAKRRAMLHMVEALVDHGVSPATISAVLPNAKFLDIVEAAQPVLLSKLQVRPGETLSRTGWVTSPAGGEHTDRDDIVEGFIARWPNATVDNVKRWFVDDPIVGSGRTSLSSSQWGRSTETMLDELAELVPDAFSVAAVG